jgi:ATP-binding cassette, subfamily B, bacterial
VRALYESGSREDVAGISDIGTSTSSEGAGFVLDVRDVSHKHEGRSEETLRECSLRIAPGDRILVEGPSGGGKSTLVSLVTGVRKPASGLVTLGGLDYSTLGARAWRRKVAAAPQFHENHIFSNTLAFNLLLGRRWPPQPEDMEEAEAVCRELGLGQLLDRMPAGLLQMVGETGWQLSYGERSRIFIARALLQRSPLIVLDESFGSLDPETLQQAMHCVRDRAPTLMVIAHP